MIRVDSKLFFNSHHIPCLLSIEITGVTLNLQSANETEVCFYNLYDMSGIDVFKKRLESSRVGIVIIPSNLCSDQDDERIISVEKKEFYNIQEKLCDELYPLAKEIKLIGITGTNGKTTVAYLAAQLARLAGSNSASIGTLGLCNGHGEIIKTHETTTPSYVDFRKELFWLDHNSDIDYLFVEMSSHALEQNRILSFKLTAAGWTNITQDHLDYHKSFDNYFSAKKKILTVLESDKKIIISRNKKLQNLLNGKNYNVADPLNLNQVEVNGAFFELEHNIENLELALALLKDIGITINFLNTNELITPPGRLDLVAFDRGDVYVDFAHTPDALENVCSALKQSFPEKRLVVIFGCGGDRDNAKRPLMGRAVSKWADKVIVTSDNPRSENPESIIDQIIVGIEKPYIRQADRRQAISDFLKTIKKDDIVLIAGKGHEKYQEVKGVKIPYSDYDVIKECRK